MKNKNIKYVIVGFGFYDSSSYSVTQYSYFVTEFKRERKAKRFIKKHGDCNYSINKLDMSNNYDLEDYNDLKAKRGTI